MLEENVVPASQLEGPIKLELGPATSPAVVRQLANRLSDMSRMDLTHAAALDLLLKDRNFPIVAGMDRKKTAEHLIGMLGLPERRPVRLR